MNAKDVSKNSNDVGLRRHGLQLVRDDPTVDLRYVGDALAAAARGECIVAKRERVFENVVESTAVHDFFQLIALLQSHKVAVHS